MDIMAFAIFLFALLTSIFVPSCLRHGRLIAFAFVIGTFIFLLGRELETVAVVFLISTLFASFGFKEGFSVIDYRNHAGELDRMKSFFRANRMRLLLFFAMYNAAFFSLFYVLRSRLLPPGPTSPLLTESLGNYLSTHHWVAVLAICIVSGVVININGRRSP